MSKVWTGERLETFIFNETTIEHLHRYALAQSICKNLDVLDIASGEGYGSNLLSLKANKVTGVDISKEAVEAATLKYKRGNLNFREGSASKIPVDTHSIDVVVSFETIEHHDKHQEMIDEIKRVLKPGGVLIMSSPDKKFYSDIPNYNNPFHVKELYFEEFKTLIKSSFNSAAFYFQKVVSGSLIIPEIISAGFEEFTGDYESILAKDEFAPVYNLCIASDNKLPYISSTLFSGKQVLYNAVEIAVKETEQQLRNTWSYKIGHFFLYPLKLIRRN